MQDTSYKRNCPSCGEVIFYKSLDSFRHVIPSSKCRYCCNVLRGKSSNRKGCSQSDKTRLAISAAQRGKRLSVEARKKMSDAQKKHYSNSENVRKMTSAVKEAMHRPDVRKKHIDALCKSRWLKVKTDVGQLELLNKWNGLGFEFEPNFQIHSDTNLFYIDGYDKKHNVVLEYDSKYHHILGQQERDKIRQQKIINLLNPKRFWRYDSVNRRFLRVI